MGEIGEAISKFLDSFKASDWLTLGIAIVSAGLSVWAIVESQRVKTKPLLIAEHVRVSHNEPPEGEMKDEYARALGAGATLFLANRGNGIAHDVRVALHSPGFEKVREVHRIATFLIGATEKVGTMLVQGFSMIETMPNGHTSHWTEYRPQTVDASKVRFVITWRQEPNMKKIRTMTVHLPSES